MITFETQADFEEAVMQVIKDRVGIDIHMENCTLGYYDGSGKKTTVRLTDSQTYETITSASDYA